MFKSVEITNQTVAGIVTYQPDLPLLRANIASIASQVAHVFIFDNGSEQSEAISSLEALEHVSVERCATNVGIAAALNALAKRALSSGYEWLVTLDQDSIPAPDMVQTMQEVADDRTPLVTPFVIDRNKMTLEEFRSLQLPRVEFFRNAASKGAITSGGYSISAFCRV